ncbi:glycoside hydrolase superfamily [Aspergillus keveii]|uniref:Glycoside hydrolase superfamily n=1 Tax=Aspergillus keveii TaxID=714993 RepID=A0ABR4FNE4_9EURO
MPEGEKALDDILRSIPPRNPPIVNPTRALYQDPEQETALRIEDLLSRMPMREKMAQLMQGDIAYWVNFDTGEVNVTAMKDHMSNARSNHDIAYRGGHMLQDWIMNDTSLSLPAIIQCEGLHGLGLPESTIFTSPIGFGASWNPELVEKAAGIVGKEARALGITQVFAPSADLARDPRHGRVEESMSEDPYLTGELVASYVRGLWNSKVASTIKHLAGFGNSEQGIDMGPVHGGERELRTTYLPPFKRALQEKGAFSVMSAFNSRFDGIPCVMNKHLLTDILRGEWNYEYWTTSDYGALDRLCADFQMCAADPPDARSITLNVLSAGGDTEGGGSFNFDSIPDLVSAGTLEPRVVDEAVRRVLRAKFDMGLFEDPFPAAPPEDWPGLIHTEEALDIARQLDREAIILLENHDGILPLTPGTGRIAVIGPFADHVNYGGYIAEHPRGIPPLDGIRQAVPKHVVVDYAKGCEAWSSDGSLIAEAVNIAYAADVAIVFVGTWAQDLNGQREGLNATTGEGYDTNSLRLVGAQRALLTQIINTGVPTIVVLSSGKPIAEPWIADSASALIQQFYPSEQGGAAIADVLFGHYNPSGRLPVSFPRDEGSLPVTYDYLASGRRKVSPGSIASDEPWYSFGYGLSYSQFEYSKGSVYPEYSHRSSDKNIKVQVDVQNLSNRDGHEVIQVYVTDLVSSVETPNKQLKAFKKVMIRAGETERVEVEIDIESLGVWNQEMQYVVEPGEFVAHIGRNAGAIMESVPFVII